MDITGSAAPTKTDYSRSRFENALTEAAHVAALSGALTGEAGSVEHGDGWYGRLTLTAGDIVYAEDCNGVPDPTLDGAIGADVILREDSAGFVWLHYGPARRGDPVAWGGLEAAWRGIIDADEGFSGGY